LYSYLRWTVAITSVILAYPLLRFTNHTVKPQPRHITVSKKLTIGGVHTGHDFILFMLDSGPLAVSRRCTHLGCRVNFRQELKLIECPCHQSRFSTAGTRLAGPAKQDLPTFAVKVIEDEKGEITGYVVTI
jgi:cytochrome b6-f complex iron-sulfur subunit